MSARPRLLDLYSGAGGAAMGYHRAGFEVVGVDVVNQPHYPFEFHQADALEFLAGANLQFDAIHASPPCQHHANVTGWRGDRAGHADLLTPTLATLQRISVPWIVENVPEALPAWDYVLCGSQLGLTVRRHRGFRRGNWTPAFELMQPCRHRGLRPFMHKDERAYADAMGCQWMTKEEARQAIPPAYTEYIGRHLLEHLEREAGAA